MNAIRSKKGLMVGMLDGRTSTLQIKDGSKLWIIPIPPEGMKVTTIKGNDTPEETYIPPHMSPGIVNAATGISNT